MDDNVQENFKTDLGLSASIESRLAVAAKEYREATTREDKEARITQDIEAARMRAVKRSVNPRYL